MTYRSVLGPYQQPTAFLDSVKYPRLTEVQKTIRRGGGVVENQIITLSAVEPHAGSRPFQVHVSYENTTGDSTLRGVGFGIHWDSSKLTLVSVTNRLEAGLVSVIEEADTGDADSDANTDRVLKLVWADDLEESWPQIEPPVALATLNFIGADSLTTHASTKLNFSPISTAFDYGFEADSLPLVLKYASWDIDGDGSFDALTDGLLFIRFAFGITTEDFANQALSIYSPLTNTQVLNNAFFVNRSIGDIDGDGNVDALTDGLLLLRYLFGLRDEDLVSDLLSANATRTTPAEIEAYIEKYLVAQSTTLPSLPSVDTDESEEPATDEQVSIRATLETKNTKSVVTNVKTPVSVAAIAGRTAAEITKSVYKATQKKTQISAKMHAAATYASVSYPRIAVSFFTPEFFGWERIGEVLALTEHTSFAITKALTDSPTITDFADTKFSAYRSQTDTAGAYETIAHSIKYKRSALDQFRLDASVTTAFGDAQDKANLAAFTDTISLQAAFNRNVDDNASFSSSHSFSLSKPIQEQVGLSDDFSRTVSFIRENVDSFSYSDAISMAVTKQETEGMSITDTPALDVGTDRIESTSVSETVGIKKKFGRSFFEVFKLDESVRTADLNAVNKDNLATFFDETIFVVQFKRDIEDSFTFGDDTAAAVSKPVESNVALVDTVSFYTPYARSFEDIFAVQDSSTLHLSKPQQEALGFSDTPSLSISKSNTDVSAALEVFASAAKYRRSLFDAFTLSESTDLSEGHASQDIDPAKLVDTLTRHWGVKRSVNNTFSLTEALSLGLLKNATEDVSIVDTALLAVGFGRKHDETATFSDAIAKTLKPQKTESVGFDDPILLAVRAQKNEVIGPSELLNHRSYYRRKIYDDLKLVDSIRSSELNAETSFSNMAFSETFATVSETIRVINDTTSLQETVSKNFGKAHSDNAVLADTVKTITTAVRGIDESTSLADVSTFFLQKPISEQASLDDPVSLYIQKPFIDAPSSSEVFTATAKYNRGFVEQFRLDDSTVISEGLYSDKANMAFFADAVALTAEFKRGFSSAASFASSATFAIDKLESDSLGLSDIPSLKMSFVRNSDADSLSYSEAVFKALKSLKTDGFALGSSTAFISRMPVISNTSVFESVAAARTYKRALTDKFNVIDAVKVAENNAVGGTSGASFLDSVSLVTEAYRDFTNTTSLSSSVSFSMEKLVDGEILSLTDTPLVVAGYKRNFDESFTYSDLVQKTIGKTPAETVSIFDKSLIRVTKLIANNVATSEFIATAAKLKRSFAESVSIQDTFTSAEDNILPTGNSVGFADTASLTAFFKRSIEDPVSFTDALAKNTGALHQDGAHLTDSVLLANGYRRSPASESIAFGDAARLKVGKNEAESLDFANHIVKTIKPTKTDQVSTSETVKLSRTYVRSLHDTLALFDSLRIAEQIGSSTGDSNQLTDTFSCVFAAKRNALESFGVADSLQKKVFKSFGDGVALADTGNITTNLNDVDGYSNSFTMDETVLFGLGKTVVEDVGFSDTEVLKFGKGINDSVGTGETLKKRASLVRRFSDSFTIDSTVAIAADTVSDKTNHASFSDTVLLQTDFSRPQDEMVSFQSFVAMGVTKTVPESIGFTETVTPALGINRDFGSDAVSFNDNATKSISKTIVEKLSILDTPTVSGLLTTTDTVGAAEVFAHHCKYNSSLPQEGVDFSEDISKLIKISPANNIVGLTDTVTINLTTAAPLGVINTAPLNTVTIN